MSNGDTPKPPSPPLSSFEAPRECAELFLSELLMFAILHFTSVKSRGRGTRFALSETRRLPLICPNMKTCDLIRFYLREAIALGRIPET